MPANVTVEFAKAQQKYQEARTPEDKLAALYEMRSTAPAHKGGENLRAEITKKIAKTKKEIEKQQKQKGRARQEFHVKKEGAGQAVLIGFPNSGKSTILKALTGVNVEIASFPFTTKKPEIGMLDYNGGKIQLVEVPAIIEGSSEGKAHGTQLFSLIRNADAIVIMLNALNALEEFRVIEKELGKAGIILNREKPKIEIRQSGFRGITVSGKNFLRVKEEEFIAYLKSCGIHHASVMLKEPCDIKKLEEALDERLSYKKAIAIANETFGKIKQEELAEIEKKLLVKKSSELGKQKILELKESIFSLLDKILVFTKKPGQEPDLKAPLVLKKGITVEEVAEKLHKDFARKLKYVKVWGSSKFSGQRVPKDYKLKNNDVIEIYS